MARVIGCNHIPLQRCAHPYPPHLHTVTMAPYKLSETEKRRLKKIAHNEARLKALGLFEFKEKVAAAARKPRRRPKRKAQPTKPTRKSRRQSKQPAIIYKPVMDDDEDTRRARAKFKAAKKKTRSANTSKFKCEVPANLSAALTAKQKKVIEKKMEGAWLENSR